jgi:hypothetical protein
MARLRRSRAPPFPGAVPRAASGRPGQGRGQHVPDGAGPAAEQLAERWVDGGELAPAAGGEDPEGEVGGRRGHAARDEARLPLVVGTARAPAPAGSDPAGSVSAGSVSAGSISTGRVPAGPVPAANALRAQLPALTSLSPGERHVLGEWLDRLIAEEGLPALPGRAARIAGQGPWV